MPEWIGQTVGKVRIEKYLAQGGMAEVFLGTHLTLDRQVAVKVMHSHIEADPDLLVRFQREAKVVAGLRHPNIVQILDFDTYEGHPYIVMEYLKGPSLSSYLHGLHESGTRLSYEQIARLLNSISAGLDYAHAQDVIHRDIKPANIILHSKNGEFSVEAPLTRDVEPIITDFGLVRIAGANTQTATGLVSGTPSYMSPEQARGDKVDYRTDIYSLGVVLYELLAGRVPFEGDSALSVIYKHINEPPPLIQNVPVQLQSVIEKVLAKDPNDRYSSCHELTRDFYEIAGLQSEAVTMYSPRSRSTMPTVATAGPTTVPKKKPARSPLLIGAILLACACFSFFLLGALGISAVSLFPFLGGTQTATSPATTAPVSDAPSPAPETFVGLLRFQDGTSPMDKITISASLAAPAQGTQYEAWLITDSGEQRISLGILAPDSSGKFALTYVDADGRNLLDGFSKMEITVEPNPDSSPNPSGQVAYSSELPPGSMQHIRHLLVAINENPSDIGMTVGLVNDAKLVKSASDAMVSAFEAGDQAKMRANAETIINLIVGKQSPDQYKDWDGDGKISDPGDGYGLLLNGNQAGYIGGAIDHADLAANASDSTPNIRLHAGHVVICAHNIEDWSTQLRDLAIKIVQAQSIQDAEGDVRTAGVLATQILKGTDINGNEQIEPIPGEGGALTAYQHAGYMSDMQIIPGVNQVPAH